MAVNGTKTTSTKKKPAGAMPKGTKEALFPVLNKKQLHFAELILSGVQPNNAYIQAGYKVKNLNVARVAASRLLTNVTVREYLNRSKKEITKTYELNRGVLLETLMKIAMGEIDEEKAVTIMSGNGTSKAFVVKQKTSPKDRAKAAEILLRIVADETPVQAQTVDDKIATALASRKVKEDDEDADE